jgi:hypothetical protein
MSTSDRERAFWLLLRRALLLVIQAIEERYEISASKRSTHI